MSLLRPERAALEDVGGQSKVLSDPARFRETAALMPSKESIAFGQQILDRVGHLNRQYKLYSGAVFRAILHRQEGREDSQWVNVQSALRFVRGYTGTRSEPSKLTNPELYVMEAFVPNDDVARILNEPLQQNVFRIGPDWPPYRQMTIATAIPSAHEATVQKIGTDGHKGFAQKYAEPYGGVTYFVDFHNRIEPFQPSQADLDALAANNVQEFFWRTLMLPSGAMVGSAQGMNTTGMYIVMPNFHSRILQASIDGPKLLVQVDVSSGISVSDLRLVAKATGIPGGAWSGYANLPLIQDPMAAPSIEHDFGMPLSYANISLYWKPGQSEEPYVDDQFATRAAFSPHPMLAVFERFDPELKILLHALTTARAPHDMEWAVATVLGIAGFIVEWLGYKGKKIQQLESEIDLVALVPEERRVVFLECVTKEGEITKKVSDLNSKVNLIGEIFTEWGIRKVVATTAALSAAQPHDSDARNVDVGILPKETLIDLLTAVKSGANAEVIYNRLANGVMSGARFSE